VVVVSVGALSKLEAFSSHHGAEFYGLPRNNNKKDDDDDDDNVGVSLRTTTTATTVATTAIPTTTSGALQQQGREGSGGGERGGGEGEKREVEIGGGEKRLRAKRMRLTRSPVAVAAALPFGQGVLVPLRAGETVAWAAEWI
jgi:dihydroorotase